MNDMPVSLEDVATVAGGGFSIGAGLVFARWLLSWMGGRMDKREDAVAAEHQRMDIITGGFIDRLERRLGSVEMRLEQCEREHVLCRGELMEVKAILQARGMAKQEAQQIVSAERLKDRAKDNGDEPH